ncbi:MAG: RNA methyltransferase [Bacteroidales bacterium]|nr:RNA methyltransferase [Bacteroidales bacterium]MBQ2483399.1 RNA methyltransferase [Bacteroidales bacterium]MBQ4197897.1 RNA methyltransferase [Bacteroidales bacterium]
MTNRKLLNSELGRPDIEEFKKKEKVPLVVVLDNVRSQFNIGSVFRSSDAFIAEKIILCGISATPPSAEIHKSALGAEFSVGWEYFEKTEDAVLKLKQEGYRVFSIEQTENSIMLSDFKTSDGEKYALVFGNEVHGVQQEVVDLSDGSIEIPQFGTKHSLNVSVCIGVVLWEFLKKMNKV